MEEKLGLVHIYIYNIHIYIFRNMYSIIYIQLVL